MTRTAQYALYAAAELAARHGDGPVQGASIAAEYGISSAFSQHILLRLTNAGIIDTMRGPTGGYFLARPPEDITLLEVLETAGKSVRLTPCTDHGPGCRRRSTCCIAPVWSEAAELIRSYLSGTTLRDVVRHAPRHKTSSIREAARSKQS